MDDAFGYWRQNGFPHYKLNPLDIEREYSNLQRQKVTPFPKQGIAGSIVGLRLANFFQPQMWSVRVSRYKSPLDVFNDDAMLRNAIERSWEIWPERFGANAASLRRMLKTFPGTASVSNFRPTVARAVVEHFCPEGGTVVDFSSGYGGRLLGALASKRRYIGIEPCKAQVVGLSRMLRSLRNRYPREIAEIIHACAEDFMPQLQTASVDLIFSSPPYFDWEKYSHDGSQSFVRYTTYHEWKRGFLQPVLHQSSRVLRRGGRLILNVSGGRRKPDMCEVIELCAEAGLRYLSFIPLLITRVPYMHPRGPRPHKREMLLLFSKS